MLGRLVDVDKIYIKRGKRNCGVEPLIRLRKYHSRMLTWLQNHKYMETSLLVYIFTWYQKPHYKTWSSYSSQDSRVAYNIERPKWSMVLACLVLMLIWHHHRINKNKVFDMITRFKFYNSRKQQGPQSSWPIKKIAHKR